ncbi:putative reverse transcriptase domain-containing protein [Tanacetum coccineum]|uniref:Reverse transcriptase domain-containing protein n=1 Tax=Tanacetum coccineum TaxID=301880 RepID=A0ABQ4XRV4_9ASTR
MPGDPYAYVVASFQASPSPDYVPGPEEPQAPLPLDFVLEPIYLEFMPPDDESDPEEDPAHYPADRDDDDKEEEEPSEDDANDEDEDEDEEEVEEHPAPAVLLSTLDIIPSPPLLPIPAPISSPSVLLPSTDRRADKLEFCLPPRKRLCSTQGPRDQSTEKRGRSANVIECLGRPEERLLRDGLLAPMTPLMEDTKDRHTQIYQRVETLFDDSQYHYENTRLLDQEALVSQEAWDAHRADRRSHTVTSEMLQADHMRQAEIATLQTFDRTRQEQLVQTLTLMQSLQGQKMAPKRKTRSTPETTTTTTSVTNAQLQAMIDQGVTAALAARDATRNDDDSHTSETGVRRTERIAREMETVFCIRNCSVDSQIKFSTCTLLPGALTWWNSYVRIVGQDVVYAMTWIDLRKKMTDKYCSRNEIKKLEVELWNFKVKGTDVTGYNQRFQELALLCVRMFPEESDKVERAYTAGSGDKKQYRGSKPLCPKCNYNHNGPCAPKCYKCNKFGHLARNCRSSTSVNPGSNQRGNGTGQGPTYFECGVRGHFNTDCPKLKNNNNNRGNQVRNANAQEGVMRLAAGQNLDSGRVRGYVPSQHKNRMLLSYLIWC